MFKLMASMLLFLVCMDNYSNFSIKPDSGDSATLQNVQVAGEVPEPATAILMTLGGLLWHRRYKRKS